MGAALLRLIRFIPIVLKYIIQLGPLLYQASVWIIKIIREWGKKPEKKDNSGAPVPEPDAKPDPG